MEIICATSPKKNKGKARLPRSPLAANGRCTLPVIKTEPPSSAGKGKAHRQSNGDATNIRVIDNGDVVEVMEVKQEKTTEDNSVAVG